MLDEPLAVFTLIAAVVAGGFALERRFAWARKASVSLLVIIGGALLSNTGVVPEQSPAYDLCTGVITSLAIVWLLFAVDLRDVKRAGPHMLIAFGIAVVATIVAAIACTLAYAGAFGDDAWKLAGILTGTYTGGSLNFAAVERAVHLDPSILAATTAADNIATALWLGVCLVLPSCIGRFYRADPSVEVATETVERASDGTPGAFDLAALLALGLALVACSEALADWLAARGVRVPSVLLLTTLALAGSQVRFVRRLRGSMQLGVLGLHLFFAVIGIYSRVGEVIDRGRDVFVLIIAVVALHGVITFAVAWLLRLDARTTSVASMAAIGGPSSAMAIAVSKDWKGLVLPGLIVGLLGYAVGTYLGIGVAHAVLGLLA